jgi:hypothetical protein
MTPERDFHYTLIKYLDIKGKQEISNIIKRSRIVYDKLWAFSGVVSYQRKMNINIKTPIEFKALLETEIDLLKTLSFEIYEDDDEYMATDVVITVLAAKVSTIEIEEIEKEIVEGSVYQSFITEISSLGLDKIEKSYLYEACECAIRNNKLAASTMLGCAAEYLLSQLCDSYYEYLKNHSSQNEQEVFERKVIKAKSAYIRLDEFEKRVNSNISLFENLGFENPKLNFNFLDVIRKVRNESGHPSGNVVSSEELQMTIGNYQHFLKRAHKLIEELPKL